MIVKIQSPMDLKQPWLLYNEDRSTFALLNPATIDEKVKRAVIRAGGNAYFEAALVDTKIDVHAQAETQAW